MTKEAIFGYAKNTADYTRESYKKVSQRLQEEPASDVFMDGATTAATKSAEYGNKVINVAREKVNDFANNGGLENLQNNAYTKAKTFGNSFWGYICDVTNDDKAKLDNRTTDGMPEHVPEDSKQTNNEKPLFGFTWGR